MRMTSEAILTIILSISCFSFIFSQALEFLNLRSQRKDIPDAVASFYDKEKYFRSLDYNREHTYFDFVSSGFSFIISISLLALGGFGWLDAFLRNYVENPMLLSLVFFAVIGLASDWLSIPFQCYGTFVLEEKYGFNKTTIKTFIADKIKGYLLGAVIGGGLLLVFMYLVNTLGTNFWIWFGLIAALFILLINMFYTSLLLPLFNKLTPLPDGELKNAISAFAIKVNFPLDHIYVIDGSKRSAKANAFFSGIGKKKKIVLYDTLIEKHTADELVAVLAHEVGHFKKKHIVWGYALSVLQVFFTLWVLSLMIFNENLAMALGGTQQSIHLNLIAFGILFSPLSSITGLFMSMLSRKNEFEADAYARINFNGVALASALKKLSVDTLSNLFPHPAYVFFHYSHPPLLKRLEALAKE
jgi:STE24 endopeptidase